MAKIFVYGLLFINRDHLYARSVVRHSVGETTESVVELIERLRASQLSIRLKCPFQQIIVVCDHLYWQKSQVPAWNAQKEAVGTPVQSTQRVNWKRSHWRCRCIKFSASSKTFQTRFQIWLCSSLCCSNDRWSLPSIAAVKISRGVTCERSR